MFTLIGTAVLGLLLVGIASTVEATLLAVPQGRLPDLQRQKLRGAGSLIALRSRPVVFMVTLWTLRTIGIAAGVVSLWIAAAGANGRLLTAVVGAAALAIVAVVVELVGKAVGTRGRESLALRLAAPIWIVSRVLIPIILPIEFLVRTVAPTSGEVMPGISEREIRDLVSPGNGEAVIEEHERRLIERAFLLDQTTAYDVMTPRVDMLAWSESRTLAEIAAELRTARFSRIPLYRETVDKITGVLYTRDAYQALISGQRDVQLKDLAREPFFVPGSVTLDRLLLDFQARRIHMGIVIDEYGGVDGLIALEDILEELVGEIVDESDIAQESIIRLSRNEILVDGSADLREINHFFNTTFPLLEHRSLNGYLLDVLGRVPEPGEKITADAEGVVIDVTAATDTQVLRARLSRAHARPTGERTQGEAAVEPGEAIGPAERAPREEERAPESGRSRS